MDIYWWIEKANGKLVGLGRNLSHGDVYEFGMPRLQRTRSEAKSLRWPKEKPVKVKLIKVI
jgi:hypothetical protein